VTERCIEDDSLICSEENCLFSRFNPSLCFEPGEQVAELVENPSNDVGKQEVAAPVIPVMEKPAQIITENITKPEARKMPQYKEGTCSNCERGPINVHNKTGLCGSCRKACEYARNPEEREAALRAAKEKFTGKPVFREGTRRKGVVAPVNKRPGNPLLEPVKTNAQQEANKSIPSTPQEAFETVMKIVTEPAPTDLIVDAILKDFEAKLAEVVRIRGLLETLNEYGANIEIPEVRL